METQDEDAPTSSVRARPTQLHVGSATHIGRRATNADAHLVDHAARLYAVADGVGDEPRSRLAADLALRAVRELFAEPWGSSPLANQSADEARCRLRWGVTQAQQRLHTPGRSRAERAGTTFAGVVVCGEQLAVGHVGDSRVYLLRASKGRLRQLTEDHTVAGDARLSGVPDEAASRLPDADALTRVIGIKRAVDLQPFVRRWEPGDMMLACTDGVSDRLRSDFIAGIMLDADDLDTAAQTLVDRAIEEGGCDNATAMLLRRTR